MAKTAADLHAVLSEEKDALLSARYDALLSLGEAKAALIEELSQMKTPRKTLVELQRLIDRNQKLYQAALKGVGAARGRLAALQEVKAGLSVYDASGTLAMKHTAKRTMEKKA